MSQVWQSLLVDHDPRLVVLAVLVCAFGASSTMNISGRVTGRPRTGLWLLLLSVCAGATVWATHFIAMLAYRVGIPTTYDLGLTALSLVSGTAVMGLGFTLALRNQQAAWLRALGGAVVGAGAVVLNYVGMAAVRMPVALSYSSGLVATSIALALGFGALSLWVAFARDRALPRGVGALLMITMVVSLHFTAMGAVQLDLASVPQGAGTVSRSLLAVAVAAASLAILLIGLVGATVDHRMSIRLAAEAERFRALSDGALEGVVVHHMGRIVDANAAARRMLLIGEGEHLRIEATLAHGDSFHWSRPATEDARPREVELSRADGSVFPAEIARRPMTLADGKEGELIAIRDLTARKESEARIAHLALHDPLTELANRRLFVEIGNKGLAIAQRAAERLAVLVLDVDDFKLVNDVHGHEAGDAVLKAVAERIRETLRECDICARFGGDEFTILQGSISQPAQTMVLVERLFEALDAPVCWQGMELDVSVSIGAAVYPDNGTTLERLLRNADTAMYRAKANGKRTSRFFEEQMNAAVVARRRLEGRLRRALAEETLSVDYQPLVAAGSRTPVAFEALVRWTDSELGSIGPTDFIPVAEETGMIAAIGDYVLRRACADAVRWPSHLRVAVNLSAAQFRRRELVNSVRRALEETGLPGSRLELEITETLLIENREDAMRQLDALRELGINIAMDDFGTGYSSLSYLQSFPFDTLKVDRAFVSKLPGDPQSVAIVQAVVSMGRSLGMRVVAEGVETEYQAELLNRLECDDIQGYLVARPMTADQVPAFLEESAATVPDDATQPAQPRRSDVIPLPVKSAVF